VIVGHHTGVVIERQPRNRLADITDRAQNQRRVDDLLGIGCPHPHARCLRYTDDLRGHGIEPQHDPLVIWCERHGPRTRDMMPSFAAVSYVVVLADGQVSGFHHHVDAGRCPNASSSADEKAAYRACGDRVFTTSRILLRDSASRA
jgi:hypothetical protein